MLRLKVDIVVSPQKELYGFPIYLRAEPKVNANIRRFIIDLAA